MTTSRTLAIDYIRSYNNKKIILESFGRFTRFTNSTTTPIVSVLSNNEYQYHTISNAPQQYTLVSLYNNPSTPISLYELQQQQQRRWKSSFSATKDSSFENLRSHQDSSSSITTTSTSSSTTTNNDNDNTTKDPTGSILASTSISNDENTDSSNSSEVPPQIKRSLGSKIRYRAKCMRDDARDRYEDMKHDARETYEDFRDNPSDTAMAGAKSMGGMIRLYGPVFIGTYGAIYFSTLALLFSGVQSGVLDPISLMAMMKGPDEVLSTTTYEFVVNFMNTHTLTKPYTYIIENNPSYANLAVAWIAVKFTEPIRLGIALSVTPRVGRYFGYTPKIDIVADDKANNNNEHSIESSNVSDDVAVKDHTIKKSEPVLKS